MDSLLSASSVTVNETLRNEQINQVYQKLDQVVREHKTDNDYLAIHGQSTCLMVLGDLIKQLEMLKHPTNFYRHFKFFRLPSMEKYTSIQTFFDQHLPGEDPFLPFDHLYSDKLLSVDFFKRNVEKGESAYHYFVKNKNELLNPKDDEFQLKFAKIIDEIFEFYGVVEEKRKGYLVEIKELMNELEANNTVADLHGMVSRGVGNLYVLLLPKKLLDEESAVAYLSSEGGNWYDPSEDYRLTSALTRPDILEALQNSDAEILKKFIVSGTVEKPECTDFPQGRIICSALTPETGVRIFRLNALSSGIKAEYKTKIRRIAERIFAETHSTAKKRGRQTSVTDDEFFDLQSLSKKPK